MDMLDGETRVHDYALERQMMLSDGVYAIAMTLLAIELKAPQGWDHTLTGLLVGGAPQFFAYVMSFFVIGMSWAMHRQSYGRYLRTDFVLSLLGLISLGFVTLVPFGTRLYAEDMTTRGLPHGAAAFYLTVFSLASLFAALSWGYASLKRGIMAPNVGPRARGAVFGITLISAPALTALGVLGGETQQPWLFPLLGVLGAATGMLRRWASRADERAAVAQAVEANAHG